MVIGKARDSARVPMCRVPRRHERVRRKNGDRGRQGVIRHGGILIMDVIELNADTVLNMAAGYQGCALVRETCCHLRMSETSCFRKARVNCKPECQHVSMYLWMMLGFTPGGGTLEEWNLRRCCDMITVCRGFWFDQLGKPLVWIVVLLIYWHSTCQKMSTIQFIEQQRPPAWAGTAGKQPKKSGHTNALY